MGSSPRLRGTREVGAITCCVFGIIPALAGNTTYVRGKKLWTWDHPRACGEHGTCAPPQPRLVGSSPRLRGTPFLERLGGP